VKVIGNREKIKRLQRKHGGWDESMEEVNDMLVSACKYE
jgi:hypothetical protein